MINPKFLDLAGNEIKIGDIVAFASGSRTSRLNFGRVMYFTDQTISIALGTYIANGYTRTVNWKTGEKMDIKAGWNVLRNQKLRDSHKAIIITMASLPKELFEVFDSLEITGKK